MTYTPAPHLWAPQAHGINETIRLIGEGKDVCLYAPTGGGKTEVAIELFRWALSRGLKGSFYVNRKLLVKQTANRFADNRLPYGIRAADYEDCYDYSAPFQVCSSDTERSRIYQRKIWPLHDANLVVVDEAHIQKTGVMRKLIDDYHRMGAYVVLLTATPIGLSAWADELVISGTMQQYRDCGAIVPARVYSPEQPDLKKIERNQTGEFIMDGKKKKIFTQTIVSSVIDNWKYHNPDARPTMLYAPDVAGSVFFTEEFTKLGVNWCHVDATDAVVDGARCKLTRPLWEEILQRFKDGNIKGISSRFKLREGIDVPSIYQAILACPIGSLASYIQTIGRPLRKSKETPDDVVITDHGGNYHRHGSPNHSRDWKGWWNLPERVVSTMHERKIREKKVPEPIRCPRCSGERPSGRKCPHCGFEHAKSVRRVIMASGALVLKEGNLYKPKFVKREDDTQQLWSDMYWGWLRSKKCKDKTFKQLAGFFAHTHGYHPPTNMDLMPKNDLDWWSKIRDVEKSRLHRTEPQEAGQQ